MEMAVSSVECDVDSGLDFQETELKLALPGGRSAAGGAERKRGFSDTVEFTLGNSRRNNLSRLPSAVSSEDRQSVESAESVVCSPGKPPAAKAQVVGWPPVRSFRKNVLKKSCKYVKVAVDGAPYLRKVDLETYSGYQQLLKALEEMFSCFTIGDSERRLVRDPIGGIEYVPTYEDKEDDWMLVGDVPWKMFVESCKRIRLMKSSEVVNLAPRSSAKVVIDHGAVPIFVKLLGSPSDDVREQAVWALGNVAGDSPKCRDFVLSNGALLPLLSQLNDQAKLSMMRNATWTLSNFCRGKPQPPFEQTKPALPALQLLIHSNDEEVLTDACWALSYLSDGTNDKIQAVIEAGVCPRLVELLLHPSPSVLIPALRTVGNIVTGDDIQTQYIINNNALPCLHNLLTQNHKKSIKKEACWTISNITAGNKDQIQAVIDAQLIAPLVHLLATGEFDIKKEAAWAISNATSGGNHDQIKFLVNQGCIKPLCDLILCSDSRIITVCLEGLENILKIGENEKNMGGTEGVNVYAQMIDEAEGLEKIEHLQNHDNAEIYEKSVKILETYWVEEEDDAMPSGDGAQAGFDFGNNVAAAPAGGFNFG